MDQDLQDLLALWLSDHDPGDERRAALLARLRADEAFRSAFVAEIRMLGMLKAVQSPEPRWLRLEDAIGWSAGRPEEVEVLAERVVGEWERRKKNRRRLRWSLAIAAAALIVVAGLPLTLYLAKESDSGPSPISEVRKIATVIQLDGVKWESDCEPLEEGESVAPGRMHLRAGRVTLAFFSGV